MAVPWLESPFTASWLAASSLDAPTRALCRQYADQGYVVVDAGLPDGVLDRIRAGLDGRYRPGGAPVHAAADRIQDAWAIDDDPALRAAVLQAATGPRVLELLRALYRREPVPFQTLNFPRGTQQLTHSDTVHFHAMPARFMCGVWIALEDIHPDAGPLHYYPGSQRLPIYTPNDLGFTPSFPHTFARRGELMAEYERFVQALVRAHGLERRTFIARKGQALVWAANLLHGGDPIRDPRRSRHSMVTHYVFEGGLYYTPFDSDPGVGRFALREPVDLRTLAAAEQRYAGMPTQVLEHGPVRVRTPSEPAALDPAQLRTGRSLRIFVWPRYDVDDDLCALAEALEGPLAARDDACLCIGFDAGRDGLTLQAAVARVETHTARAAAQAKCELLLVDERLAPERLARLHGQVSAALALPCTDAGRLAELGRIGRPLLRSVSELAAALTA